MFLVVHSAQDMKKKALVLKFPKEKCEACTELLRSCVALHADHLCALQCARGSGRARMTWSTLGWATHRGFGLRAVPTPTLALPLPLQKRTKTVHRRDTNPEVPFSAALDKTLTKLRSMPEASTRLVACRLLLFVYILYCYIFVVVVVYIVCVHWSTGSPLPEACVSKAGS